MEHASSYAGADERGSEGGEAAAAPDAAFADALRDGGTARGTSTSSWGAAELFHGERGGLPV